MRLQHRALGLPVRSRASTLAVSRPDESWAICESARGILPAILDGADQDAPRLYAPGWF
jgi:hypothetical protein